MGHRHGGPAIPDRTPASTTVVRLAAGASCRPTAVAPLAGARRCRKPRGAPGTFGPTISRLVPPGSSAGTPGPTPTRRPLPSRRASRSAPSLGRGALTASLAARGQHHRDVGTAASGTDHLDPILALLACRGPRREHRKYLEPLDPGLHLDPEDVAGLRTVGNQRRPDNAAWLAGARCPPRPRLVRASTGELDIHPMRHARVTLSRRAAHRLPAGPLPPLSREDAASGGRPPASPRDAALSIPSGIDNGGEPAGAVASWPCAGTWHPTSCRRRGSTSRRTCPTPLEPPLHPGTRQPVGPDDLAPLFPMALIGQEVSTEPWIDVPGEVLDVLRLWRPTPLVRAEAPRGGARHPGPHLLQGRVGVAGRLAQAEHRRPAGLLQQAGGQSSA